MQEATASKKREGKKSGQEVMAGQQQGEGQGLLQATRGLSRAELQKARPTWGQDILAKVQHVSALRHSLALSSCSHGAGCVAL